MASCDALQLQCIPIAEAGAKPREGRLGRELLAELAGWFGVGRKVNRLSAG